MSHPIKYDKILDALQKLLEQKNLQTISVSEIAQTAGIGKGSIYIIFHPKNAIFEAWWSETIKNRCRSQKHWQNRQRSLPLRAWQ